MNRIAKLLAVAAMSLAATVHAADPAAAKADPAKGETLYGQGAADRNIPACASCHGANGNSAAGANPSLAGQNAAYLYKQLVNFAAGKERQNAIMTPYAKAMTDQEMRDVAAYLEKQKPKLNSAKNPKTVELGQKIFRGGIPAKGVPACAACHGATGAGIPNQYPRIGGQWAEYTEAQLVAFRSGARHNNAPMTQIAAKMSDAEIKAVSDYIAGVR